MKRLNLNKFLGVIFAFVLGLGAFVFTSHQSQAYAATEYTVTFHHTDSTTITQTTVNGLISKPTETAPTGYKTLWSFIVDEGGSQVRHAFDFSTKLSSDLDLYAEHVRYYNVNYYEYTSIADNFNSNDASDYQILTTYEVMAESYASSIDAKQEVGYNFLYWTNDLTTKAEFIFSTNRIMQDINLYPVYEVQTFTIRYLLDGEVYTNQTVNYNTQTTAPTAPTKEDHTFIGWFILDDQGSNTQFDFSTSIIQNISLVAKFESASYAVTYTDNSYATFTGNATVVDGDNLTFTVTLTNYYNQNEITIDDLIITGEYFSGSVTKNGSSYEVILYQVKSAITVNIKSLELNRYSITLPSVEGLTLTVISQTSDYIVEDGAYKVYYGKTLRFQVAVQTGYFAKSIAFTNVTVVSSMIYQVNGNMSSVSVTSNCELVRYAAITLKNTDNMTYNISSTYLEIVDNVVKVELNSSVTFTAQGNTGYYVKSVSGANKSGSNYVLNATNDREVTFTVVKCYTVKLPQVEGVNNYSYSGQLYNTTEGTNLVLGVEENTNLTVTVNLLQNYSQSNVTLTAALLTVEKTGNTFVIKNINQDCIVTIGGVNLNAFTLSSVATEFGAIAFASQTVDYAANASFTVTLSDAYTKTTLSNDNFEITGNYANIEISGNTVTINTVVSDLQVKLVNFTKNIYTITLIENTYGKLTASTSEVEHGSNVDITAEMKAQYSKTILTDVYLNIIGEYTSTSIANGEVTLVGVKENLTIQLKDVPINHYIVTLPQAVSGQFEISKQTQSVAHGYNLAFSITLNRAYTQNIEKMKVFVNSQELVGAINNNVVSYNISNITEDKTVTITPLTINTYQITYLDGETLLFVRTESYGTHPSVPTTPNKSGHAFENWYIDSALTQVFDFSNYVVSASINVYAKFTINEYTIMFDLEGTIISSITAIYGTDVSNRLPQIPSKTGYTKVSPYWDFASEGVSANSVTKDVTVQAVYTIDVYTVNFVALGRTISSQQVEYLNDAEEPANKDVYGYTFMGWDNVFTKITHDTVVNGVYEINSYKVTYIDVKNSSKVLFIQTVTYNNKAVRPNDDFILSDREGYTVYGWYSNDTFTTLFDFSSKITQDVNVYGNIDVTILNVKFIIDGREVENYQVEYGNDLTTIPTIPTKTGYTQVAPHWSIDNFTNITNDITCEAIYTINKYTITFVFPDGSTQQVEVAHGESIKNLPEKNLRFGQTVSANKKLITNITSDATVKLKVKDYLWLILVGVIIIGGGLIAGVIVMSIKLKKAKAGPSSKEVELMQQKINERQAYIDRMNDKE